MELRANHVLEVLRSKGVEELHHANTVVNASTYLRKGKLLARGVADEQELIQSGQQTDQDDVRYGLWYDIFLDTVDIHDRKNGRNYYGPVLFSFDVEVLSEEWLATLWITRENPQNWTEDDDHRDRWFVSIEDVQQNFRPTDFGSSIVLRSIGGKLRIKDYITRITVYVPERGMRSFRLLDYTIGALHASCAPTDLFPDIHIRECPEGCDCKSEYSRMRDDTIEKFFGI